VVKNGWQFLKLVMKITPWRLVIKKRFGGTNICSGTNYCSEWNSGMVGGRMKACMAKIIIHNTASYNYKNKTNCYW
jgi:hypothetical protein